MLAPVLTSIRIQFSSFSCFPIRRLTEGIELLMLMGIGFLGKEKLLVIRTKIA